MLLDFMRFTKHASVLNLILFLNVILMYAIWCKLSQILSLGSERSFLQTKILGEYDELHSMIAKYRQTLAAQVNETSNQKWIDEVMQALNLTKTKCSFEKEMDKYSNSKMGNYFSVCILSCGFSLLLRLLFSEYLAYCRMKTTEMKFQNVKNGQHLVTMGEFIQYRYKTRF